MKNRFTHLAQDFIKEDYIKDNQDILTLPEGAGKEPNITVETPLETDDNGFPEIDWNFFEAEADPATCDDDAKTLIEHLAELQVPISVLDRAKELIDQNQGPQDEDETSDDEMDQEDAVSDDLSQNNDQQAPEKDPMQSMSPNTMPATTQ